MDWKPLILVRECESADKLRDTIIRSLEDRLKRLYGTSYGLTDGQYFPENYYFTWLAYIRSQLVFQNPRAKIGSGKLEGADIQAKGLETAINRWVKDTDYRTHLRAMGFDLGFLYGVSIVRPQPAPYTFEDKDDPPWRPASTRIDSKMFSLDPLAACYGHDARYMQHVSIDDKDKMIEWAKEHPEEGWSTKLLEDMATTHPEDILGSNYKDVPDRGQIAWREIWCPEINDHMDKDDDPDDFHGTIYTLPLYPTKDSEPEWIRPPRPFFGPRWGPYTVYGAYEIPGCPYPLAPLVAADAHIEEVNAQAMANNETARNYKRIGLFDVMNSADAQAIAGARSGTGVGIAGMTRDKWVETEIGGLTDTAAAQEERARQIADKMLGINDVQRGGLDTGALATEVLEATAASNVRTSDLKEQYTSAVRRELMTVAWYMWKMDKVVIPFTKEEQAALAQQFNLPPDVIPKAWTGSDNVGPFDSLELSIEPYSMQRTDEPMMQARAMQAIQVAQGVWTLVAQVPAAAPGMKKLLAKLGDAMNWPDFADILPDDVAQQMGPTTPMGQPAIGPKTPQLQGDVTPPMASPKPMGAPKPMNGSQPKTRGRY